MDWVATMTKALVMNCSPVRTGATAEIVKIVLEQLSSRYDIQSVCIDDYEFHYCKGCRVCHTTAECVQHDDVDKLIGEFEKADIIVAVSPSYWADVPGQFKAFIDRCTPWSNTHDPHKVLPSGKKGYAIVLRTGPNRKECDKICDTIEHFYGHLEIAKCGRLGLTSIDHKADVELKKQEIVDFCNLI